jgi:hypothetical protein
VGSFSELVMSFDFRPDTPDDVLAAFAALAKPLPEWATWGPAPRLPAPVVEPSEWWCPDWRDAGDNDEFEHEPWRHDWASWLSSSMSVATVPSAALVWTETKRWNLTCRCSFKTWADSIFVFLQWLGPFIDYCELAAPELIGYIDYEGDKRPHLLWVHDRQLVMENLNGTGFGAT